MGAMNTAKGLRAGTDPLKQKLQQLEQQKGGFAHAMRIAKAKADLAYAEVAKKHPVSAMGLGALKGGAATAALGPRAVSEMRRSGNIASELGNLAG